VILDADYPTREPSDQNNNFAAAKYASSISEPPVMSTEPVINKVEATEQMKKSAESLINSAPSKMRQIKSILDSWL